MLTIDGRISVVRERCSAESIAFYCLPCRQRLANGFQVALHVAAGTHCLARECMHHGLELLGLDPHTLEELNHDLL